jgi:pimeloyl-ACP methyl ester carboxylesterase
MKKPDPRPAIRTVLAPAGWALRTAVGAGARKAMPAPALDRLLEGGMLDLPGRGRTFVIDVPGPTPDAPVVVLLHALGTTAHLSWALAMGELSRTHRVIAFDQRWHGRGIRSSRFRFSDCADDVAAVLDELGVEQAIIAGYSMGGAIAQLVWHQHPRKVVGLVLCSTARNFRGLKREKFFFPVLTAVTQVLAGHAFSRVEQLAATLPEAPSMDLSDPASWGRSEFRSTSAWTFPEVLAELGRFNSASWVGGIDVPTTVVVTQRDHTIPQRRQRKLASAIEQASLHVAPGGHASIVLGARTWLPVFREALGEVTRRAVFTEQEPPDEACGL